MIAHVTAVMLAAMAPAQQADTTFAVDAGGRLEVSQIEGVVSVTVWDRAEMRVVADYDEDEGRLEIRQSGGTVHLSAKGEWGEPVYAEFDITVPRRMALEMAGASLDVGIEGAAGDVSVTASDGAIAATAVDGDVILDGITSDNVSVNAVDGDITYEGTIVDGGRYVLSTHDGDLYVTIPDGANARISIDTFSGDLDTDFPVELEGDFGKKRISFTVGTGKALVELSAFDGTISLREQ
jgi:hypothetical protein